jgi:hypothetical protein
VQYGKRQLAALQATTAEASSEVITGPFRAPIVGGSFSSMPLHSKSKRLRLLTMPQQQSASTGTTIDRISIHIV